MNERFAIGRIAKYGHLLGSSRQPARLGTARNRTQRQRFII